MNKQSDKQNLKRKNIFQNKFISVFLSIVLLIGSLIFSTYCAEIFLRWHYRNILSSAAGVNYFYLKSLPKFARESNAFGLRGKHFDLINPNTFRIAVLGDSLTYGQGVYPYDKRFPEQVHKLFNERYPDHEIEIINLGISGLNLREHNKYMKSFVLATKPDFVLYQWYTNDMSGSEDFGIFMPPPLISNKKLHKKLIENSVLYFLMQRAWKRYRIKTGLQKNYTEYLQEKFNGPQNVHSVKAKKLLNELLNQLQQEKIPHGIVLFPSFATPMNEYKLGFLHDMVLETCSERKIDCLDLREAYSSYDSDFKILWANLFDPHPSELAHRVAAEQIVKTFGDKWAAMVAKKSLILNKDK